MRLLLYVVLFAGLWTIGVCCLLGRGESFLRITKYVINGTLQDFELSLACTENLDVCPPTHSNAIASTLT